MIDRHWILLLLLPLVSCRGAADGSRALATANLAALEETVDMESRETDADEVLLFDDGTVDLGEPRGARWSQERFGQACRGGRGLLVVRLHAGHIRPQARTARRDGECRLYIIKFKAPNNFIGRYLKPYL